MTVFGRYYPNSDLYHSIKQEDLQAKSLKILNKMTGVQPFSALTFPVKYGRKRGGMFWKSYSDEGNRRYMLRSGIWEESKKPKSCLRAKRRAGQLADAQTIPAHRLTTPLRLLRSSDRFLQRRMSLLPLPQKVYLNRPRRFLRIPRQKCYCPK